MKVKMAFLLISIMLTSCAVFEQTVNTSKVKFSFDRVGAASIAGIDVMHLQSINSLSFSDIARATALLSSDQVPLDMTIYIKSENPVVNTLALTLVALDWVLILDGHETARGVLNTDVPLPAGQGRSLPIKLSLNMIDFFKGNNTMDLLKLAMAFAGAGDKPPRGVALKIRPTIGTPIGQIKYKEILIEPDKASLSV